MDMNSLKNIHFAILKYSQNQMNLSDFSLFSSFPFSISFHFKMRLL